jgi:uridine phosphorylase
LVEELAYFGVTRIIGFGSAGSLVPELPKGTHVVASTAIMTDGTSHAYTEASTLPVDVELYAALEAVVDESGADVTPVKIATVDAIYRETDDAVRRWLSRGAQAINMETSPLYAASAACGVKSLWIGRISDSLLGREWDSWMRAESRTDISASDYQMLVRTVCSLVYCV